MNYLNVFRGTAKPPRSLAYRSEDSTHPLLPLQIGEEDPKAQFWAQRRPSRGARIWWRRAAAAAGVLGVIGCTLVFAPLLRTVSPDSTIAQEAVDALYARQSTSLEQASARYTLRTGRSPPKYYEEWFHFAQEKRCLIDEYDRVHRDFEPFYQLAIDNPTLFAARVAHARNRLEGDNAEIARLEIRDGKVSIAGETAYGAYWPDTVGHLSEHLPNMTFFMNGRDEPRVAFNYRAPGARTHALSINDSTPFLIQPHPTSEFFAQQSGCRNIPLEGTGFMSSANNASSFLISSAKPGFTTDLYPMLSMTKMSPCFADIVFPGEYHYGRSWWYGHYRFEDNVPWDRKEDKVYWRGMSNGGMILGDNYHDFARFRAVDLARAHPELMDVAITTFAETLCEEDCDRDAVIAEYNITGVGEPREDVYGYKYVLDLDGTTFSGRFLGLLKSGSLVFKSTLFEEYFSDWLKPFEHYVPVLPDLSDLVQKSEWANKHPQEARMIQQKGLEFTRRVITDEQNDCYLFAVLIEWAQLQGVDSS
ncbi:glycosyl transferase family 90-domain-containing protein [Mycena alexandri]|uniref:Glycosyl transferase family 90-domain-containing protein n=1 Tax=Mycena alexandri TaxID=1745969 RepID=A0AAD6SV01_9AGAR|nr:glycosyl transferase family 90-domain-containing protein [Mycena alexandri]